MMQQLTKLGIQQIFSFKICSLMEVLVAGTTRDTLTILPSYSPKTGLCDRWVKRFSIPLPEKQDNNIFFLFHPRVRNLIFCQLRVKGTT